MNELTEKEKQFIINLLRQVTINAMAPDAAETVAIIKSISEKLK